MSIYRQLLEGISGGGGAAMRTVYTPGGAARSLCAPGEIHSWSFVRSEDDGPGVLTEYFSPRPRFFILGGGHIALPLSLFAAHAGFSVTVFDDRPEFAAVSRFPNASAVICDSFERMAERLAIGKNDYVAIVTRGHRYDAHCLRVIFGGEMPHYLGMIGSRRKNAALREQMLDEGVPMARLDALHAPIGLPIGAATPEEIAISIVAELIAERRRPRGGAEPVLAADCDFETIRWLAEHAGEPCALATVVAVRGSAPRGLGAKMVILPHGQIVGSIGGGCAEADVRRGALDLIGTGANRIVTVDLTGSAEDDGMVCGGVMDVLLEDLRDAATS